jgi:eukaryotic-like serine/threonine-protein kinase
MPSHLAERLAALLTLPDEARVIGAFRLKRPLGQGSFAPVWLADEVASATTLRQAAVKLFAVDERNGPDARQEIIAEAERLCRVEHPNIVRFYALPVDEARGVVGLAMEYVGGGSLAERLREAGTLPVREAVEAGVAVASALAAVHAAGLVHRDIWTANVIENAALRGSPAAYKLIDFGIAARDAAEPSRLTAQAGKRGYVDPVCYRDLSPATPRSDLYALGALLFVCLAGKIPAAASGSLDELVLSGDRRPLRLVDLRPEAPPRLVDLIAALLAPDPAERPASAEAVALALEQIRGALSGRTPALPPEENGPFRGLGRFEREHRDVFFGRRVEVALAIEALRSRGLVALVGPSGSGKSSLARAGILPALEDGALGGPRRWDMVVISPGSDPRQTLEAALVHMNLDAGRGAESAASQIEAWLAENRRGLVLLVDQLEELATLAVRGDALAESRAFAVDLLARLGEQARPSLRVIVTARRDLLDPILRHRALGRALMRGTVLVAPLGAAEWGTVIDAALESYGYAFEDEGLREEVLGSLAPSAEAMPLVEFALAKLWQERDKVRQRIPRVGWEKLRGIPGALDQHAEATLYPDGRPAVDEAALRRVLRALTTSEGARAPRPLRTLASAPENAAALGRLKEARLVVVEGPEGHEVVTLAHETVLSHWRRLANWVAEDREDRLVLEDLERVAELWDEKKDDELLYRRRRLLLVEEVQRAQGAPLHGATARFYRTSWRAARQARLALVTLLVTAVTAAATSALVYLKFFTEAREAEIERRLSEAERDRANAERDLAQAERDIAEARAEKAEAQKQAAISAFRLLEERLKATVAATGEPEDAPKPIDPGVLRDIEAYLRDRDRQNGPVPEPLENVIPEALERPEAVPVPTPSATEAASAAPTASAVAVTIAPPMGPPRPEGTSGGALSPTRTMALGAAHASLWNRVRPSIAACRSDGGPHGMGRVAVVLEPSGRVASVAMDARFAGTSVGKCVDAAFRQVEVPPFDGQAFTFVWSFVVR